MISRRRAVASVAVVAFAAYAITLRNGFVFDDLQNVLGNRWITSPRYLGEIFSRHVAGFEGGIATTFYRPLMHVIFLGIRGIFGEAPWAFHLVNVSLHAAVSVLVLLLAEMSLGGASAPRVSRLPAPLVAALLFAVHPIHTESVAWVSGVTDVSCTFLFLLSFLSYARSTEAARPSLGLAALSAASFLLAALAKETALVLPAILVVWDLTARNGGQRAARRLRGYLPFAVAAGAYFALRLHALGGLAPDTRELGLGVSGAVVSGLVLVGRYLLALVWPVGLSAVHAFVPSRSMLDPRAAAATAALAALLALAWIARRRRHRFVPVGVALLLVPLVPALYLPALGEGAFAERYLYLPSVGFVILGAGALAVAAAWGPRASLGVSGAFLLLVGGAFAATVARSTVWRDEVSLWSDAVGKVPGSAVAREYLGYALYARGDPARAVEQYRRSLELDPGRADTHNNLGVAFAQMGRSAEAEAEYRTAIGLRPSFSAARVNLAMVLAGDGRLDEAEGQCAAALRDDPRLAEPHNVLGIAYAARGDLDRAIAEFDAAVRAKPGDPTFLQNLERARSARGSSAPPAGVGR